jgi:hypothetical protein
MTRRIALVLCVFGVACSETNHASVTRDASANGDAAAEAAAPRPDAEHDANQGHGGAHQGGADAAPAESGATHQHDAGRRDAAPAESGVAGAPSDGGVLDGGIDELLVKACGRVPVTFDEWEQCYTRRECDWEVNCVTLNTYEDVQDCIANGNDVEGGRLAAELRERRRAVAQGRASLNADAFAQCILETSREFCNTARTSLACAKRYTGTIGDGHGCYADVECASLGAHCVSSCTGACCMGTCTPRYKEGEPCDLYESCEPGLECHDVCKAGDVGSPCTNFQDCDQSNYCDVQAGVCKADLPVGSSCTDLLQCGGQATCVGLSIVDSAPGRCARISAVGDPCDDFCYGNLTCGSSRTCESLPALGASCSALLPCSGVDAACKNGRCALRDRAGAKCANSQTCLAGLFCTSELGEPDPKCAAPRAPGEPCRKPSQCASYLCSGSDSQTGVCIAWTDACADAGP